MENILVIQRRARGMVSVLARAGFHLVAAEDKETGLRKLYELHPTAVILAEETDEGELCRRIRDASDAPIIVLGRGEQLVAVGMLEAGADVYLTEPVSEAELVARLRSLLRRAKPNSGNPGLDPETRRVELEGRSTELTPTEFRLFSCLVHHQGQVMACPRLIAEVWGRKRSPDLLHLYVRRLKQKLGLDSVGPHRLLSYRGAGYCFCGSKNGAPAQGAVRNRDENEGLLVSLGSR